RIGGKAKRIEGFRLEGFQLPGARFHAGPAPLALSEQAERIADALICPGRAGARRSLCRAVLGGLVDADRPGRAVAGDRFLLVARNLAVREAGEVIVALVVRLDVFEAEHEILPLG